jgi:molybdopterin adenylyltransferase
MHKTLINDAKRPLLICQLNQKMSVNQASNRAAGIGIHTRRSRAAGEHDFDSCRCLRVPRMTASDVLGIVRLLAPIDFQRFFRYRTTQAQTPWGDTKDRSVQQNISATMKVRIGILVASDRASKGIYEDLSGRAIREILHTYLRTDWEEVYRIVPDNKARIASTLRSMIDKKKCSIVITTGGTGPAPRDVTPEATEAVCNKMLPGFGELMRTVSVKQVPTAILSRQSAGVRKNALIINLPGKPKSIKVCLEAVFPAIPDCVGLIGGPRLEMNADLLRTYQA